MNEWPALLLSGTKKWSIHSWKESWWPPWTRDVAVQLASECQEWSLNSGFPGSKSNALAPCHPDPTPVLQMGKLRPGGKGICTSTQAQEPGLRSQIS